MEQKIRTIIGMSSFKPFILQNNLITGSLDSIDVINGAHFMDDNLSTCLQVCMTKVQLKQIGWIVLREPLLGNTENSRLCASFALLWFISHSVTFALDIQTPFDIWQCGFKVLNQTPWREMIPPSKQLLGNITFALVITNTYWQCIYSKRYIRHLEEKWFHPPSSFWPTPTYSRIL